jgi:hypothetical protein
MRRGGEGLVSAGRRGIGNITLGPCKWRKTQPIQLRHLQRLPPPLRHSATPPNSGTP